MEPSDDEDSDKEAVEENLAPTTQKGCVFSKDHSDLAKISVDYRIESGSVEAALICPHLGR